MPKAINHLLPKSCYLCESPTNSSLEICQACLDDMPRNKDACYYCGIPSQTKNTHCTKCRATEPALTRTLSPYLYDAGIKLLISSLKFKQDITKAELLAHLFLSELTDTDLSSIDYLLPVPSHRRRLRERGFNQAYEISKILSKKLNIPILSSIQKHKHTSPQASLSARQRHLNLKNSFSMRKDIPIARIAIIDDVITTGTTVNEIASLLRNNGIQHIEAWAIARTE